MTPPDLDPDALEKAAIEYALDDARPWSNMPDETVAGYMGRDAYRERAREVITAYLTASRARAVPVQGAR